MVPLDDPSSVRLVEPEGLREPYLCLSHCWGDPQGPRPLRTLKANLSSHLGRIGWETLPETFQEAIEVVRLINQRYLWIDSLCIVQDDIQDWDQQSGSMATIFRNSYLTLAATKAKNSHEGLHDVTNRFSSRRLTTFNRDLHAISLHCRPRIPHFYFPEERAMFLQKISPYPVYVQKHFPLLGRAWVLQERLLSSRILHFGPAELLWECSERFYCECRPDGKDLTRVSYPKIQYFNALKPNSDVPRPAMWRSIVTSYSALAITHRHDVLPALRGVATQLFGYHPHHKIMSGLWEGSMLLDLMWEGYSESENIRIRQPGIPSWSWANMQSRISYSVQRPSEVKEHATIQGIGVAENENSHRVMRSATSITIIARILPGRMSKINNSDFIFDSALHLAPQKKVPHSGMTPRSTTCDFDRETSDEIQADTAVYCILLVTFLQEKANTEWGLLVKHAKNRSKHFERVGYYARRHWHDDPYEEVVGHATSLEELFQHAERTAITIV